MQVLKNLNLLLAFVLELCLLAAFGYWGWQTGSTLAIQLALGIGMPLAVAVVWWLFAAPKAPRRFKQPWLAILKIFLFAAGAGALALTGQIALAAFFFAACCLNLLLAFVWNQS